MKVSSHYWAKNILYGIAVLQTVIANDIVPAGLPLYYWRHAKFINFGDYLSLKLLERIVGEPIRVYEKKPDAHEKKLLAIGSIISFARDNDVIWGSGINGKALDLHHYKFTTLDIRAVRGPLTREYLKNNFGIECPEVYGDPALLLPYFFPEFKKSKNPCYEYIIIPHYSDEHLFPKEKYPNAVYVSESWDLIIKKILNSKLVISSSLHGIIVAEAFGIPARVLAKPVRFEPIFKFVDYYSGTNRPNFDVAFSIEEAIAMGGEKPGYCDLKKLYRSFPFEFWPHVTFKEPKFK